MQISLLLMEEIAKLVCNYAYGICSCKSRTYEVIGEQKYLCGHGLSGHSMRDY